MKTNSGERLQAQNAVISGTALIGLGAYILGGLLGRNADQHQKNAKAIQRELFGRESKATPIEALLGQAIGKGLTFGFLFASVVEFSEAVLDADTGYSFWGTYGLSVVFIALGYVTMNTHRLKKQ